MAKRYSVVLTDLGAEELKALTPTYLKRGGSLSYFLCKSIEPNGIHYLQMVIEEQMPITDTPGEFELQIPHMYVRAIVYAPDTKSIGFLQSS